MVRTPENAPTFTPEAEVFWEKMGSENQELMLDNTWCVSCRVSVHMRLSDAHMSGDCLVLHGKCATCGQEANRVVEPSTDPRVSEQPRHSRRRVARVEHFIPRETQVERLVRNAFLSEEKNGRTERGLSTEEYFARLREHEARRGPFRDVFLAIYERYCDYLFGYRPEPVALKRSGIIRVFIDFLYHRTEVEHLGDVTRGMVNSRFRKWWKQKVVEVGDTTTLAELREALEDFFLFLADEEDIVNETALRAMKPENWGPKSSR